MRTATLLIALLTAVAAPGVAALPPRASGPALWVVPAMRAWQPHPGRWMLAPTTRIVVPAGSSDILRTAGLLASDMATITGTRPAIVAGATAKPGDIVLAIGRPDAPSTSPEAYDLVVTDIVMLRAATPHGLFDASQSLLQLLAHDPLSRTLPRGAASDWPDYRLRVMMIDVGRKYYRMASLEREIRKMAWLKMNALHLHFTDWPAFRLNSPRFPGLAAKQSYDRADIAELEAVAHRYHVTIIPEIDLPAHASALIRYRPSLAFDCPALRQSPWLAKAAGDKAKSLSWVVDITKQRNRAFVGTLLDTFIPWFDGPYFHIGGDEYNYDADKNRCPELLRFARKKGLRYPGDVFVDWINEADRIVRRHGKTTIIWSWWRFRDDKTSIEPNKDIVIDTWNAPRLNAILAGGYKVIASPEDELYVSPGLAKGPGTYGTVDTRREYDTLPLVRDDNVLGYGVSLWADDAEDRDDAAMLGEAYQPMAVLAERSWSGHPSPSIDDLRERLGRSGERPEAIAKQSKK